MCGVCSATLVSMLYSVVPLTVRRAMHRGVQSVLREPGWGTSLASIFGVLFLCQMCLFLVIGLEGGIRLLQEKTDLRLEITETATDAQIQDFFQNVRALPYVDDVLYITREQAFDRMKKRDPELIDFVTKFGIQNPFPETMGIRLKQLTDYPKLVEFLRQPVFSAVVNPAFLSTTTDQEQNVQETLRLTTTAHTIVLLGVGILFAVLLFVVIELIRRRVLLKQAELYVQQLVGSPRLAILTPFFVEVFVLLSVALLLSIIVSAILVFVLPFLVPTLSQNGVVALWAEMSRGLLFQMSPLVFFGELLLVITLALLGTMFAFRDQLTLLRSA